jgi:hypothetical protein
MQFSTATGFDVRTQLMCGCHALFFEQRIEVLECGATLVVCTVLVAGFEPVASVAAFGIRDAFRAGLPTFVVRRRVVEAAISANMKIGAAMITAVAKPDSGIRCEFDPDVADKTLHGLRIIQCGYSCQKLFCVFRVDGGPMHSPHG